MRKFTLLICSSFFIFLLNAQVINKGDRLFGGSFSFSVFNINNSGPGYYTSGNVGLLPSYAWVIKDNLSFGIRGSMNFQHTKSTGGPTNIINSYGIGVGPFIKKYKVLKNKFGIYFNNEVLMNYNKNVYKDDIMPDVHAETLGMAYNFQPGVFYKFSENFFGEGNIGGLYASYSHGNSVTNLGIGASFLQYFNLGINYRIQKKG